MKPMVIGCLLILGIVTVGCTTTKSTNDLNSHRRDLNKLSKKEIAAYNANPENTDKIVCKKEKPVGSNIPERVCYSVSRIKDRQARDQQALKTFQGNAPPIN